MVPVIKRVPTFVQGLDERMEGGIPEGFVVLICGRPGSMKSSFTFNILYHLAVDQKKKGLYISLEQTNDSLLLHMSRLGMDIDGLHTMNVLDLGNLRADESESTTDWFDAILRGIEANQKHFGLDVLAIDSLNAMTMSSNMDAMRPRLLGFLNRLRQHHITTLLITEMDLEGRIGPTGAESFLADGIIHLELRREGNQLNKYIAVVKMRATLHSAEYYPLLVENNRFAIVER